MWERTLANEERRVRGQETGYTTEAWSMGPSTSVQYVLSPSGEQIQKWEWNISLWKLPGEYLLITRGVPGPGGQLMTPDWAAACPARHVASLAYTLMMH